MPDEPFYLVTSFTLEYDGGQIVLILRYVSPSRLDEPSRPRSTRFLLSRHDAHLLGRVLSES